MSQRPGELPLWHSETLTRIGGYKVAQIVQEHAERCVMEASDDEGRLVTLTVLDPRFSAHKRQATEHIERARPLLGIKHPNLVGLLEAERCTQTGLVYVASELFGPESLGELISGQQKLDPEDALAVCQAVVEGLALLGQKRIAHGAVRPSCVSLDSACRTPRLGEAGLPWLAGSEAERMHCVAPEQAEADGIPAHTADIYSAGVVLYRCLTGRYPFEGTALTELQERKAAFDVPDPRELEPSVPEGLAKLVGWLCERKPRARYQSAHTVNLDMLRLMADQEPQGPRGAKLKSPQLLIELLQAIDAKSVDPQRPRGLWGKGAAYAYTVSVSSRGVETDEQTFNTESLTVGRSPECELRIDNPIVSRKHLQIRRIGTQFVFKTLSATNTTALGERAVEGEVWFMPGMPIRLAGKFVLEFAWAPGALDEAVKRAVQDPMSWLNEPTKRFNLNEAASGGGTTPEEVEAPLLVYENLGTKRETRLQVPFQIGHGACCDLRLDNTQAYKVAMIVPGRDATRVYNLTADPGLVRVNGEYVHDRSLVRPGDVIRVADERLKLS